MARSPPLPFFFNDTAATEIYTSIDTLSLHDALPILRRILPRRCAARWLRAGRGSAVRSEEHTSELQSPIDISYAVFCLKKKNKGLYSAEYLRRADTQIIIAEVT